MKSQYYLLTVVSLCVLGSGCMNRWGRGPSEPSALNSYLDQHAVQTAPQPAAAPKTAATPGSGAEDSSVTSLASKLEQRLAEAKKNAPPTTEEPVNQQPTGYVARVEALQLPEADKQQILREFAAASDGQWEELLSKLEPVFSAQHSVASLEPPSQPENGETDLVQRFASKLVNQHLQNSASPDSSEKPQRLPSASGHEDTSHLAAADPTAYPKTIDLERGRTSPATLATQAPQEKIRRDTNIQLAAHVTEVDAETAGLYPEDLQSQRFHQAMLAPNALPDKKVGPKKPSAQEETVGDLAKNEYRVMQILWERGQVSLEALHKQIQAESQSSGSSQSPNPELVSIDELHATLFDLKGRGWIADTRRGNTIAYWATRNQPEEETGNWKSLLGDTIDKLEKLASDTRVSKEERTIAQLRLRMLYLVAGRKDDAMERVEGLTTEEQEVWSNTLFGLADYMKLEEIPIDRRHSLALGSFRRAMSHLEQASPLELRNLEFIQSVDSFGNFKPFPTRDFQPKQEVLLYVEVDNFSSQDVNGTFETVLQSNYEIYDQAGRRVDARQFPEVKDTCRARRRDFYVPFRIYMPENVSPGTYRLELTVRDPAADKFGQASLEFNIRN